MDLSVGKLGEAEAGLATGETVTGALAEAVAVSGSMPHSSPTSPASVIDQQRSSINNLPAGQATVREEAVD